MSNVSPITGAGDLGTSAAGNALTIAYIALAIAAAALGIALYHHHAGNGKVHLG